MKAHKSYPLTLGVKYDMIYIYKNKTKDVLQKGHMPVFSYTFLFQLQNQLIEWLKFCMGVVVVRHIQFWFSFIEENPSFKLGQNET